MSEFYRRLDEKEAQGRIDRIFASRPENLHDYQGCANDPNMRSTPIAMNESIPAAGDVDYEKEVKAVWPDAVCVYGATRWEVLPDLGAHHIISSGNSPEEAWQSAYFRLPKPASPPSPVKCKWCLEPREGHDFDDGKTYCAFNGNRQFESESEPSPVKAGEGTQPVCLNCPFCGNRDAHPNGFRVYCDTCGASGPYDRVTRTSIEKWNRRAALPALTPEPPTETANQEAVAKHDESTLDKAKQIVRSYYVGASPELYRDGRWTMRTHPSVTCLGWSATERDLWIDLAIWLAELKSALPLAPEGTREKGTR